MSRTLSIYRETHANQSMTNLLKDLAKVTVTVDGSQKYVLPQNQWTKITLNDGEHMLCVAEGFSSGQNYRIPAGTEDYNGWFFHKSLGMHNLGLVPVPDPFGDRLLEAVQDMFRGNSLKELISSSYNTPQNIKLIPRSDYFAIGYYDSRKLFSNVCAWKIPYSNMGLYYPQTTCDGYMEGLQARIGYAIDADRSLGIEYTGVYRMR